jgi:hypothetical protein
MDYDKIEIIDKYYYFPKLLINDIKKNVLETDNINLIIQNLNNLYNLLTVSNDNLIFNLYNSFQLIYTKNLNEINNRINEIKKYLGDIYKLIFNEELDFNLFKKETFINGINLIFIIKKKLDNIFKLNNFCLLDDLKIYEKYINELYLKDSNIFKNFFNINDINFETNVNQYKIEILNFISIYYKLYNFDKNFNNKIENIILEYEKCSILFDFLIKNDIIKFIKKIYKNLQNLEKFDENIYDYFTELINNFNNSEIIDIEKEKIIKKEIENFHISKKIDLINLIINIEEDENILEKITQKNTYDNNINDNKNIIASIQKSINYFNDNINNLIIYKYNFSSELYYKTLKELINELINKNINNNDYLWKLYNIKKIDEYELYENLYENNYELNEEQIDIINLILKMLNFDYNIEFNIINKNKLKELIELFKKYYIINQYHKIYNNNENINILLKIIDEKINLYQY